MTSTLPASAAERLRSGREALAARLLDGHPSRADSLSFPFALSALADAYFRERLDEISGARLPGFEALPRVCLLAVGGYGRSELCLRSDIDVLVLHEGTDADEPASARELARALFHPLWDLGLELGHGFRSLEGCLALAAQDESVCASLLDVRWLAGPPALFARFRERFTTLMDGPRLRETARRLAPAASQPGRPGQPGLPGDPDIEAGGWLEPDLKEGGGGLRDYHRALWMVRLLALSRGSFGMSPPPARPEGFWRAMAAASAGSGADEAAAVERQGLALSRRAGYLMLVRNRLHRMVGRKNDRLWLDLQEDLARLLGFANSGATLAVEGFLAELHAAMADVRSLSRGLARRALRLMEEDAEAEAPVRLGDDIESFGGELRFAPGASPQSARAILPLFLEGARTGLPIAFEAREAVDQALPALAAETPSGESFGLFLEILRAPHALRALTEALETGFLGGFIPEFGAVQDHVQFDAYHVHPVGAHTLVCLGRLSDLAHGRQSAPERFRQIWQSLARPDNLLLAAFFHDIGKTGPDHAARGESMARDLLGRFGVDGQTAEEVAFLVRWHLLLPETATRRDLGDEMVVLRCAQTAGGPQRLAMLHLLAWADSIATGPKAWNDWTASLLAELYAKASRVLQSEFPGEDAAPRGERVREEVLRRGAERFGEEAIRDRLEVMDPRYLLFREAEDVLRDVELVGELERLLEEERKRGFGPLAGRGVAALRAEPLASGGWVGLTIASRAGPLSAPMSGCEAGDSAERELFATLCGVLSLHDVNILTAEIFRWRDQTALRLLTVSQPPDALYPEEFWGRVRQAVQDASRGKLSLDWRLARKRCSPLALAARKAPWTKPCARVDNALSDFHTVVEVKARDRVGLLYDVASALEGLRLDVHLAKIATHKDQAFDVFYVRDENGRKIDDPEQMREIEMALLYALERE